jgi:23S rRNA pseudouridine2605 synthase
MKREFKREVKRNTPKQVQDPGSIRLNKFIANSGICSRREADVLIITGAVTVNGKTVTELGTRISPGDKVQYGGQPVRTERPRYLLLNKPKGYITTMDDPDKRNTVMVLIQGACKERIYPVGRLDRNTTGLLLFTNDGDIAKKLTHPRYGIKKIYHVFLDKPLSKVDFQKITEGIQLEDGFIKVDSIEYVGEGADRKQIGLEIHSGKNRIVRRIFEKLDYQLIKLDRVYYAGLTKKNLPRGHWRFLDEKEINLLKMISSSKR